MEGILIPQKVFVGDTAEYLYPFKKIENISKHILESKILKNTNIEYINQSDVMTILKVEIKTKDKIDYFSISFIPWETGEISFPDFSKIGINQSLPNINIASILENSKTEILQAPRAPILIPGTTRIIYSFFAVLIICIFLVLFSITALKKNLFKNSFIKIQNKRIKKFSKGLKKLKKKSNKNIQFINNIEKEKYINHCLKYFENSLREYCINIIRNEKEDWKNFSDNPTYSEILNLLKKEFKNAIDIYFEFKDVFEKLQNLRFGKNNFENFNLTTEFTHFINKSSYIIKISEEQIQKNKKWRYKIKDAAI